MIPCEPTNNRCGKCDQLKWRTRIQHSQGFAVAMYRYHCGCTPVNSMTPEQRIAALEMTNQTLRSERDDALQSFERLQDRYDSLLGAAQAVQALLSDAGEFIDGGDDPGAEGYAIRWHLRDAGDDLDAALTGQTLIPTYRQLTEAGRTTQKICERGDDLNKEEALGEIAELWFTAFGGSP